MDLPRIAELFRKRGSCRSLEIFTEARARVCESPGWQLDLKTIQRLKNRLGLLRCDHVILSPLEGRSVQSL